MLLSGRRSSMAIRWVAGGPVNESDSHTVPVESFDPICQEFSRLDVSKPRRIHDNTTRQNFIFIIVFVWSINVLWKLNTPLPNGRLTLKQPFRSPRECCHKGSQMIFIRSSISRTENQRRDKESKKEAKSHKAELVEFERINDH